MNGIMAMLGDGLKQVQNDMAVAKYHAGLSYAIGEAITVDQQIALSRVMDGDPGAYQRWLKTDAGRAATRAYVDAYLGIKPEVIKAG